MELRRSGSSAGGRIVVAIVAALALSASSGMTAVASPASGLPAGFEDSLVANVSGPTELRWTPDGRMLVIGKTGALRVITPGGSLLPDAALNLATRLCTNGERGLVGLAVHPDFANNHFIYLTYTYPKFGTCNQSETDGPVNRVSRFVLPDSNVIDPASETVLVESPPMYRDHHTGGDLHFGRDGLLYASIGDSGAQSLGWPQDKGVLAGKVIRITDSGGIPAGNPYTGAGTARCNVGGVPPAGSPAGTICQEILTIGLRNPFRMAVDPNAPGVRFFVNDVGQHTWEEISEGPLVGGNYGWPVREGPCAKDSDTACGPAPAGMADPTHWYHHVLPDGGAVTGGAFVPNGVWPADYDGDYLFADYVFGKIYQLVPSGTRCLSCSPPTSGYQAVEFATAAQVVSMRFGPFGSTQALYYVTRDGSEVRRISFVGAVNRSPSAVASADPTAGNAPLTVSFSSAGSSDPDGDALTFEWDLDGDGVVDATGPTASHEYVADGSYTATLTARDGHGGVDTASVTITVGNAPPVAVIETPTAGSLFSVGERLVLHGSATDDGVPLPDSALTWEVLRHHATHTHPFLEPVGGNDLEIFGPEPEDLDAASDSYLEVRLTATDGEGLSNTVSRLVMPRTVDLTFASDPPGLQLTVGGTTITGPTRVRSWDGWALPVSAPDQTDSCGTSWVFSSWSDGGAATHTIVTPPAPQTYTATFTAGGAASVTTTLTPVADTYVSATEPTRNFGTRTTLRTDASPVIRSYVKFDLSSIPSAVTDARLRVLPTSRNNLGFDVRQVSDTSWGEQTMTYANAPTPAPTILRSSGPVTAGTWSELDVTPAVAGGGLLTFAITSPSSTATSYSSRESGTGAPRLVVTSGGGSVCDLPPSVPANVSALAASSTRVDVRWDAASDDGSVVGYDVFRDGALLAPAAGTTFSDTSVAPGVTYEYRVRSRDDAGQVSALSAPASVTTPPGSGAEIFVAPSDDTFIRPDSPTANFGSRTTLEVDASSVKDILMRFPVSGIGTRTVTRAVLRLYCLDGSSGSGGTFRRTDLTTWNEATVNWNTAPAAAGPSVVMGPVSSNSWIEVDVTAFVTGDGVVSLRVSSTSSNGADYSSTEGAAGFSPELVITVS